MNLQNKALSSVPRCTDERILKMSQDQRKELLFQEINANKLSIDRECFQKSFRELRDLKKFKKELTNKVFTKKVII